MPNSPSVWSAGRVMTGARAAAHAVFGLLILIYVLVFHTTLLRLADVWAGNGTFQYGFLILPITLFLIWSRRHALAASVPFRPSLTGTALIAAFSVLWMSGALVGVQLVQQFAVIALLPSLVLAVYGFSVVRALLFPLAYLFFAFPWPVESLVVILQHVTAEIAVRALQFTGFIVYLDGVMIETPIATWHVAVACSGIKFFLAMAALGLVYAHLFFRSMKRRFVFVLLAFLLPILANGLRVYFTVVIGEVFGVQYASGTDHMIFGWQFFGTVLLLYFLAGWPWREALPEAAEGQTSMALLAEGGQRPRLVALLSAIPLLSGPTLVWALGVASGLPPRPAMPPSRVGAWQATLSEVDSLGARFRHADRQAMVTYSDGSRRINLVTAEYLGRPRYGHKLFMAGNHWYDPALWSAGGASRVRVAAGLPQPIVVHQATLSAGGRQRLVWRWYEVGGQAASGILQLKWLQLRDALLAKPVSTRVIVLSTPLGGDRRTAQALLGDFMRYYVATDGVSSAPKNGHDQ